MIESRQTQVAIWLGLSGVGVTLSACTPAIEQQFRATEVKESFDVLDIRTVEHTIAGETTTVVEESARPVDFLFVVDNSGSMGNDQAKLIANFEAFVRGNFKNLSDSCIGVTTSDFYRYETDGAMSSTPYFVDLNRPLSGTPWLCNRDSSGDTIDSDALVDAVNAALNVGTHGSGSEKMFDSLYSFLRVFEGFDFEGGARSIDRRPNISTTPLFRKGAFRAIVLLSDEREQSSLTPADSAEMLKSFFNLIDEQNDNGNFMVVSVANVGDSVAFPTGSRGPLVLWEDFETFVDAVGQNSMLRDLDLDTYSEVLAQVYETIKKEVTSAETVIQDVEHDIQSSVYLKYQPEEISQVVLTDSDGNEKVVSTEDYSISENQISISRQLLLTFQSGTTLDVSYYPATLKEVATQ